MKATAVASAQAIMDSVHAALHCLRRNFRTVENGAGWYHYLDDPDPGITASAVGLFTFQSAKVTFERSQELLAYISRNQVTGHPVFGGGWPVRTTQGFPIVESTAWVVRALSGTGVAIPRDSDMLQRGLTWLENSQNTDLGWGSHRGQPSRVFTSALVMLALQEGGGSTTVIENGHKWLVDAQSPGVPAWGPLPGAEPTLLHTAITLLALLSLHGSLTANDVKQTCAWMFEQLEPGHHFERATVVEEYDVPYLDGERTVVFQNSLPHFAGPVAITALLAAGWDPMQPKIFDSISAIIESQSPNGNWELPRSPLRPSIWAIWPFVSALMAFKTATMPTSDSQVHLIFPGCAVVRTEASARPLTRRILFRNAAFDWARNHRLAILLWSLAVVSCILTLVLVLLGRVSVPESLLALVLPTLLLVFQLVWTRWERRGRISDRGA